MPLKYFAYQGPGQQSFDKINSFFSFKGTIGCDVETVSLDDRTPLGAGFAISPDEAFYFPIDSPIFPWDKLQDPVIPIIFHNGGFDIRVLEDYKGIKITNFHDSCLAAMILGLPAKLGELCLYLFGRPIRPITDLIGEGKSQITMRDVPEEKVVERGCLDAKDCLEAWETIKDKVPPRALELETRFIPVAMDMERVGIRIDKDAVHRHRVELQGKMQYYKFLAQAKGFNPGSTKQLGEYLEAKGYKILYKRGKDGKRRARLNKEMIDLYYSAVPEAVISRQYRSIQTLLTHLIRPLDEGRYIQGDRIYPRVNLNVTDTGRISRSKPATQNINESLRDIIVPSEGNVILDGDYSQIELRWAAYLWDDKAMQDIFKKGGDIHTGTAEKLINEGLGIILGPNPKVQRRIAKDLNFLMLFGGDELTMWQRKRIPTEIGSRLIAAYFRGFPGIANGIAETKRFALANGYTETYYGRRRNEEVRLNNPNPYIREAALRELINHPIQGSAAETMKEALYEYRNEPQFHTVHDEDLLDVPPGYTLPDIKSVAPFDTPIGWSTGKNWKEAK